MIDIRIRPVTRFIVTRYSKTAGSEECGEYQTSLQAQNVASAFEARSLADGKQVGISFADERMSELGDMDLMAELIRRNKYRMQPAPKTRTFVSPHSEICLGIGRDHTADLTLDDEALAELERRTGI